MKMKTKKKSKPKFRCFICRKSLYSKDFFVTIRKGGKNVIACSLHPGVLSSTKTGGEFNEQERNL